MSRRTATFTSLVFLGLLAAACDGGAHDASGPGGAGGAEGGAGGTSSGGASKGGGGSGATGGGDAGGSGGAGAGGGGGTGGSLPEYATFHLNYTQDKDWSKCAERDFVVFDMLDTPEADIAQCQGMGAKMLCYFSSQYEEWRDDAGSFGALDGPLDGWPGEQWVDPADPKNLAVMIARLDLAASKGCDGVDVDNIDRDGHEEYVSAVFYEAQARGLLVSQKNAIEKIDVFWALVDLYQNEQCQEYKECEPYQGLGRPVHNIEYSPCKVVPYLYSHRKDMEAMDAWEEPCSP